VDPFDDEDLRQWVQLSSPHPVLFFGTQFMLRTSSRTDEVEKLTSDRIMDLGMIIVQGLGRRQVYLINFGSHTKASSMRPNRFDMLAAVMFLHPQPALTPILQQKQPFKGMTAAVLRQRCHKIWPRRSTAATPSRRQRTV
jgi:hypothetical protein